GLASWLAAPALIDVMAPGLAPKTKILATGLTRIMMPAVLFVVLSGWAAATLHGDQHFGAPAAVGIAYNVAIITAAWVAWTQRQFRWLAVGTVVAYGLQLLIQVPALLPRVGRPQLIPNWRHPGLVRMLYLAPPVLLGAGTEQLNLVVTRLLASGLSEGTISVL